MEGSLRHKVVNIIILNLMLILVFYITSFDLEYFPDMHQQTMKWAVAFQTK
jgi:hypothetical protein